MDNRVKLNDLFEVVESEENIEAFVNIDSGKVITIYKETFDIADNYDFDNIDQLNEWDQKDVRELWEIEKNYESYIRVSQVDMYNEYRVMDMFVGEIKDEKLRGRFRQAITHKSYDRKFERLLKRNKMKDEWRNFKERIMESEVINWCEFNGINYTRKS